MKTVEVKVVGTLLMCEYCSQSKYDGYDDEMEAFYSEYYMTNGWESVKGIYIDDDEENVIKKKGKYAKVRDYFHNLFKEEGDHPLPVDLHTRTYTYEDVEFIYEIELEDDEEFDIKKVQLIKSEYEIDPLPYFILAKKILYDGKEVFADESYSDYGIEGKGCSEYTIEEFMMD